MTAEAQAAEPQGAPAPEPSGGLNVNDYLGEAPAEEQAEAPEGEAQAEATEEETPKGPEQKGPKKGASIDDDALFSEEALATPEGIAAAKAAIQESRRKTHREYFEFQKREGKFKAKLNEFKTQRDNFMAQARMAQADFQALRTGDAATALQALGRLTGQDPAKIYEEISINIARNGKKPAKAPEVEALERQIQELRAEREAERLQQQQAQTERFIQQRKQELAQAAGNADSYPRLSALMAQRGQDVVEHVVEFMTDHFQRTGERLDDASALAEIESQLQAVYGAPPAPKNGGAPNGGAGRETSATAKPEQAQRPPQAKSLSPGIATQSAGSKRDLTEEESLGELARNLPPDFWAQFGMT